MKKESTTRTELHDHFAGSALELSPLCLTPNAKSARLTPARKRVEVSSGTEEEE
jgi:hypothetical protein